MTDAELIQSWKAGDQHAATAIVERYSGVLRNTAFKLGESDEIEELVQDVFVRAFNAIHAFRGERAAFNTWLIVILRRLIVDRVRARVRDKRLVPLVAATSRPVSAFNVLDRMIADETRENLFSAIGATDDLALVRMRLAGVRYSAIAAELGAPEASLRVRYNRIRARLRKAAA